MATHLEVRACHCVNTHATTLRAMAAVAVWDNNPPPLVRCLLFPLTPRARSLAAEAPTASVGGTASAGMCVLNTSVLATLATLQGASTALLVAIAVAAVEGDSSCTCDMTINRVIAMIVDGVDGLQCVKWSMCSCRNESLPHAQSSRRKSRTLAA